MKQEKSSDEVKSQQTLDTNSETPATQKSYVKSKPSKITNVYGSKISPLSKSNMLLGDEAKTFL